MTELKRGGKRDLRRNLEPPSRAAAAGARPSQVDLHPRPSGTQAGPSPAYLGALGTLTQPCPAPPRGARECQSASARGRCPAARIHVVCGLTPRNPVTPRRGWDDGQGKPD